MSEPPEVLRGPVRHYHKGEGSIEPRWWVECPGCGLEAMIDRDQYDGTVSINCPDCDYHEKHDLRRLATRDEDGEGDTDE